MIIIFFNYFNGFFVFTINLIRSGIIRICHLISVFVALENVFGFWDQFSKDFSLNNKFVLMINGCDEWAMLSNFLIEYEAVVFWSDFSYQCQLFELWKFLWKYIFGSPYLRSTRAKESIWEKGKILQFSMASKMNKLFFFSYKVIFVQRFQKFFWFSKSLVISRSLKKDWFFTTKKQF